MKNKRIYYGLFITLLSLFILTLVFNDNVWGDEAFTMITLKSSYADIIKITAADVHPPLYYLIAKVFVQIFGYSVVVVKIASVIPIILTMILGATLVDKHFGKESIAIPSLFIGLMAFAPNFLTMSYELRMYSWGIFFVTFSGLIAYEIYKEGITLKKAVLFIIVSLAAAYTHYFALATVAIIYLFLFVSLLIKNIKYIKECIIISIITIIGYLPWLFVFIKQLNAVSNDYWIKDITFNTVIEFIKYPFYNKIFNINFIVFIIALIALIITIYSSKERREESIFGLMCISFFFLTVALGTILSIIIRPIFVIRYAFPATALLWLGILIGLKQLLYSKLHWIIIISVVLLNGFYSYEENYYSETNDGVEQVKMYINDNTTENNIFVTNNVHFNWTVLRYYFPNNQIYLSDKFNFEKMKVGEEIYQFSSSKSVGIDEKILNNNNIQYELELSSNIDDKATYVYKLKKVK